ncbi:MAG: CheR family methyltransferase, partial [Ectothiorhodospiraceae bacterium]
AVQDPETAAFDAMPASAIAAGCQHLVASAQALPERILACITQQASGWGTGEEPAAAAPAAAAPDIVPLLDRLLRHTGHDFSLYKDSTVRRRVERRMAIHECETVADYAAFLDANPQEIDLLFRELLIGVTAFFRDPDAWDLLRDTVLPEQLQRLSPGERLRAWVVGCSTGEEAYSLAMVLREAMTAAEAPVDADLQIFASDLSPDAVDVARRGVYPAAIREHVDPERLERFFTQHGDQYRVRPELRDRVLFARHDVALDPPFTNVDLIVCRNLLIYFDQDLQNRLLPLFHYSLRPGGVLFLGRSETAERFDWLFAPLDGGQRLYRRLDSGHARPPELLLQSFPPLARTPESSVSPSHETREPADTIQAAAEQVLLQVYAPAAVVLNAEADIVFINGRIGRYLEPAAGKADWNIHAMARDGLREPLVGALRRLDEAAEPVHLRGLGIQAPEGEQRVDVTVQALREPAALAGMTVVVFRDAPMAPEPGEAPDGDLAAAYEARLQQYREEVERLREDARSSRAELQASNEELQSTNEELQSTNEELTTSKEEMQSMNEELQTINSELQTKLDDLALAQSDLQNLLNSIDIAIIFLDQDLNVRRYTERVRDLINLRDSDVGRPLTEITSRLDYPDLHDDATGTLRTLVPVAKPITTSDGERFRVRIMPYRRVDNVIDGVVVTLVASTGTEPEDSDAES